MSLILDLHTTEVKFSEAGHFSLALGSAQDAPFSLDSQEIPVFPGTEVTLSVDASERQASKAFQGLEHGTDRTCKLESEKDPSSTMFKSYTEKTCR